ncbi:MAG: carbamoyltransferase C-terminal domain-containing protein [Pseudomonadota bacterium]|nr:carbamoyltransferase C-terminal domain-containing protein [Pseudomonadota bacterium]
MKILGLSTMGNSAAAITIDGNVVAAIEEERLTRLKNDGGFPIYAIRACLDSANIKISDLDQIAVYWQPWRFMNRSLAVLKGAITDPKNLKFRAKRLAEIIRGRDNINDNYPELRGSWIDLFRIKSIIKKEFGNFSAPIKYYDHHDCHAASVLYLAHHKRTICLTYDGGGESDSTVIYSVNGDIQRRLKTILWPNSLGHYYSAFTGFLGFRMLEGEYKMMGLAPYGEPLFKDYILNEILQKKINGEYELNTKVLNYHAALRGVFSSELESKLGKPRQPNDKFNDHHHNIASSVQSAFEEIFFHMLVWAKEQEPNFENLYIAGGCGLNVTANGKVIKNKLFKNILIPPAPHDAGCAIGATFLAEKKYAKLKSVSHNSLTMNTPYLGKTYSEDDIKLAFKNKGLPLPKKFNEDELLELISTALSRKEVIAWFQGASEFGPRALGNRSFIADPRDDSIRNILNKKIKKRELFRPFAPSCKIEVANDFFEIDQASPYMNIVANVREDKKNIIPAVTHIDGTARVHTVDKETNPLYWKLIDAFEKKTGIGVVLNTSFNIQEPIVENPSQAIDCFLRSSVEWLVVGSYICDQKWREEVGDK